nr:BlaI/MecI/CopY family transcriptional regulator [candidate division Zixibacteria bacterium]
MTEPGNINLIVHPDRPGLEKFLGKLEAELMEIIWANDPMTVKRVLYFINKNHKYAYTTVMTVMARLVEKGLLSRQKEGHSFVYSPLFTKKEFLQAAIRGIMSSLVADFNAITVKEFHRARKTPKKP